MAEFFGVERGLKGVDTAVVDFRRCFGASEDALGRSCGGVGEAAESMTRVIQ